jgi:hypothetical protein
VLRAFAVDAVEEVQNAPTDGRRHAFHAASVPAMSRAS